MYTNSVIIIIYINDAGPMCCILQGTSNIITSIHIENVDQYEQLPSQIMEELVSKYRIPENKQVKIY
jgi:hypothetical protein